MRWILKHKKGLTLLEIVIAVAILSIISMAMLSLFSTGFSFVVRAGNRGEASYSAQGLAELQLLTKSTGGAGMILEHDDHPDITSSGALVEFPETVGNVTVVLKIFQPSH
jgi:prepilin-type N-terminal cleavage/methylation domain-containing protein